MCPLIAAVFYLLHHTTANANTCLHRYRVMLRMWADAPRFRPTFAEVQGELIVQQLPGAQPLLQVLFERKENTST